MDQSHVIPKWKLDRAIESILEFSKEPFYVGISWGKDSVVVLHIVLSIGLSPKVFHMTRGVSENPYTHLVRDKFLSQYNCDYLEILGDYDPDIFTNRKNYKSAWRKCWDIMGTRRYISGIRSSEGPIRRLRAAKYGYISQNTCAPLNDWKSEDIFAYLIQNNLPIHPNYAMLGGGRWKREKLRVDRLGGAPGRGGLRDKWEQEYFAIELRKLIKLGDTIIS